MATPKDILLVGSGAVGAICKYSNAPQKSKPTLLLDALVLKRSGLARVTAVARSNYDLIESTVII